MHNGPVANIPGSAQSDPAFAGLDLLSSAVVVLDGRSCITYCNAAAENLFAVGRRSCLGNPLVRLIGSVPALTAALQETRLNNWSYTKHDIVVTPARHEPIHMDCTISPLELGSARYLLEFRPIDRQLQAAREEHEALQQSANRELIRNLVHEVNNPLGGIRGSAQLLERELDDPALREYTQVIIQETDRLQELMHRLLSSHRALHPEQLNIHAVLEPVRMLICAEFPRLEIRRDYDTSLPEPMADRSQLTQIVLNILRNAAQAVQGEGEITMRTRIRRQVTLAKKRYRLALELQIIDNGPGIPDDIRDQIFYPLISRRAGGTGLGLALAHSLVQLHQGSLSVESVPGRTCFSLCLPLGRPSMEDQA